MTIVNPLSEAGQATVEAAARATRISLDSAERAMGVQLEYAKGALAQAALNARAVTQVKDVQGLMALPNRLAETALENLMGYSRSLYEVASDAQAEYSRLAEERMASLQQAMAQTVEQSARSIPGGGDIAVAALKSQMAATTAAFDSFTKAAKHFASFADAGVKASGNGRPSR